MQLFLPCFKESAWARARCILSCVQGSTVLRRLCAQLHSGESCYVWWPVQEPEVRDLGGGLSLIVFKFMSYWGPVRISNAGPVTQREGLCLARTRPGFHPSTANTDYQMCQPLFAKNFPSGWLSRWLTEEHLEATKATDGFS